MKNFIFIGCALFGIFSGCSLSAAKKNCQVQYYTPTPTLSTQEMEEQCIIGINEIRQQHGLQPLKHWPQLSDCAREHSKNMALKKCPFGHAGFDDRDKKMNKIASLYTFGENVAWNSGYDDPVQSAIEGWMKSQGHKENILNHEYEETGLGIFVSKEKNTYKIYFTQLFATKF